MQDILFPKVQSGTRKLPYRPLHILELGALSDLPEQIATNLDKVMKIVNKCGSFLTIRENRTYFIHQSAKDFLLGKALDRIFPSSKAEVNYTMFSRSREVMSRTLQHDIYTLHALGFPINKVEPPVPDPLAVAQCSCLYGVDHLLHCDREDTINDLKDGGSVHQFLSTSYIYWLEALSLMKNLPDSIVMILKLENQLQVSYTNFKGVTRENPTNIIRPIKVPIYIRLYMIRDASPYIAD
jgi:hypothetical protein